MSAKGGRRRLRLPKPEAEPTGRYIEPGILGVMIRVNAYWTFDYFLGIFSGDVCPF